MMLELNYPLFAFRPKLISLLSFHSCLWRLLHCICLVNDLILFSVNDLSLWNVQLYSEICMIAIFWFSAVKFTEFKDLRSNISTECMLASLCYDVIQYWILLGALVLPFMKQEGDIKSNFELSAHLYYHFSVAILLFLMHEMRLFLTQFRLPRNKTLP